MQKISFFIIDKIKKYRKWPAIRHRLDIVRHGIIKKRKVKVSFPVCVCVCEA